jgi:hypothetical protein
MSRQDAQVNWPPAGIVALAAPRERCNGREAVSKLMSDRRLDTCCHCALGLGSKFVRHFTYDSWTRRVAPEMDELDRRLRRQLARLSLSKLGRTATRTTIDERYGARPAVSRGRTRIAEASSNLLHLKAQRYSDSSKVTHPTGRCHLNQDLDAAASAWR